MASHAVARSTAARPRSPIAGERVALGGQPADAAEVTVQSGRHREATLLPAHQFAATRHVADQRGAAHGHALKQLGGDRGLRVLPVWKRRHPHDVGGGEVARKFRRGNSAQKTHAVAEAASEARPDLGLELRIVERATEVEHRVLGTQVLHDIQHHRAASRPRQTADVDELEAGVSGELRRRSGAVEALQARVVGQHQAELRCAAQRRQLLIGHHDDAVGERRETPLCDRGGSRRRRPHPRRDVRLAGHRLGHILMHVVHEARDERR